MTKAYSYIRFSSNRQMSGDSLRRQVESSEAYAQENGLELDTSFKLQDLGLSAFDRSNLDKGALGGFLSAVKNGRIEKGSVLLVESLDRLSRDQLIKALSVFLDILSHDITIVTIGDKMVYEKKAMGENYASLLISITIMARAHEESLTKSKRVKAAWINKIERAGEEKLTARCPAWLELSSDRKTFKLIPERAEIVKEIIRLSQTGLGQWVIQGRLNERKEPNWSNKPGGWNVSYIAKILNNPALYGEFQPYIRIDGRLQPHGEPRADYFPPLITKDEFLALQSTRKLRQFAKARKGTNVPNLLSGLLKCGYCGATMSLVSTKVIKEHDADGSLVKSTSRKAIMCEHGRRGIDCYAPRWDYGDFEKSFLMFCSGLELSKLLEDISQTNNLSTQNSLHDAMRLIDAKLDDAGRRLQNLVTSIEDGRAPAAILTRMETLETEIEEFSNQRKSLQAQIKSRQVEQETRDSELKSMSEILEQLKRKEGDDLFTLRAALADHIRRFIREVSVFPAGKISSPEMIEEMKRDLLEAGFSEQRVQDYISIIRTSPERVGKSGRYASARKTDRHFVIKTRNGGARVVYPDFDDPANLRLELPMLWHPKVSEAA